LKRNERVHNLKENKLFTSLELNASDEADTSAFDIIVIRFSSSHAILSGSLSFMPMAEGGGERTSGFGED